jgi:dipicolinate synthase subunit B
MNETKMTVGFAMCGSFCTHARALEKLYELVNSGFDVIPVMSENVYTTDTRFGRAKELIDRVEEICSHKVIHTIVDAEPLGPEIKLDAMLICPCTGNTLAKLAAGITDTSVCMAAKAHLRGDRPLVITLASNDAMSANMKNIATLLNRKHVYFVPMRQDDPEKKPHSLVADFELLMPTLGASLEGKQYRKVFI